MSSLPIDFAKLGVSYGLTGNSFYGNYLDQGFWGEGEIYDNPNVVGRFPFRYTNQELKPEIIRHFNVGLQLAALKNRVTLGLNYYTKNSNNIILGNPIAPSFGVNSAVYFDNTGEVKSSGFEFDLSASIIKSKKLIWVSSLNISTFKTEIVNLNKLKGDFQLTEGDITVVEGGDLANYYLPQHAGYDDQGRELIFDENGNAFLPTSVEEVNASRKVISDKSMFPKYFGGISNMIKYKSWECSFLVTFSMGNYILDNGERTQSYFTGTNNLREDALTQEGTIYYNGILGYDNPLASVSSDRFLRDGSYIRFKDITIAYYLPNKIVKKAYLQTAKIFFTAQNLFTITQFKGWDPEFIANNNTQFARNTMSGVATYELPQLRSYHIGFNLSF